MDITIITTTAISGIPVWTFGLVFVAVIAFFMALGEGMRKY